MITRLRLELEIDTASHSMRVIEQRVVDGMPTTQVAPEHWPLCAVAGCEKQTAKITGKYCSRAHFALARTHDVLALPAPARRPVGRPRKSHLVVDAVTGIITPRTQPVTPAIDYSTFSFHEGVEACASS